MGLNKFLIIFILVISFMLVNVQSLKIDENSLGDYNEITRTIKIIDDKGKDIAFIQLLTPLHNKVGLGYQRVAEFEVRGEMDLEEDFYGLTKTYDKNKYDLGNKDELNRVFDWKYKTEEIYFVDDYACSEEVSGNGTNYTSCEVSGQHQRTRDVWLDFDKKTKIKENENLTIGLYTNVQVGDYVEWIPEFAGLEIEEWAVWDADLNVGLVSYYKLNETTGSTAFDSLFLHNGTITGATKGAPGIIGTAYSFDGFGDYVDFGDVSDFDMEYNLPFSISFWNNHTSTSNDVFIGKIQNLAHTKKGWVIMKSFGRIILQLNGGTSAGSNELQVITDSGETYNDGTLRHFVVTYDGSADQTGVKFYVNGTLVSHGTTFNTLSATILNTDSMRIGATSTGSNEIRGNIDEVAIYNRTLSQEEVTQLYNDGDGITYTEISEPIVNLDSPINNTFGSVANQFFNSSYTASGDLVNATFSIWNSAGLIYNETDLVSGSSNSSSINFTFTFGDEYLWNYEVCDDSVLCAFNSTNFTITISPPTLTGTENRTVWFQVPYTQDIGSTGGVDGNLFFINQSTIAGIFTIDTNTGIITNNSNLGTDVFYTLNVSVNDSIGQTDWELMTINSTSSLVSDVCRKFVLKNILRGVSIFNVDYCTGDVNIWNKLTFFLGESIDNLVDGWIRITGNLNVTEDLFIGGDIRQNDNQKFFQGDADDVSREYNSTDWNWLQEVGSGIWNFDTNGGLINLLADVFISGDLKLEFGDLVSEQNPDAVNAIRIKATNDVDIVLGDASGYFSVWDTADNNAVFYVNNVGDVDLLGDLTIGDDIFMSEDGIIGISASSERILFDGTGGFINLLGANIGIGTSTPQNKLNVIGDGNFTGNLIVTGNITSENVFIPQYIFSHTNATQPVNGADTWTNVSFAQEESSVRKGIEHTFDDNTNDTFTFTESGVYRIFFDYDMIDDSVGASDIDVAGRVVYINGTEIFGSVFETDVTKQAVEGEITHSLLAIFQVGEKIKFQFIAQDSDVSIQTHGTFGDHPDSATISINKIANLN